MTGGLRETGGERKGVIEVLTFTLEGCAACAEMKEHLKQRNIPFRNIVVDENLGTVLEKEYLTDYYPIVAIVDKPTKNPYWVFVTQSVLDDSKIIHWQTIPELALKVKLKYDALQTTSFG